MSVGGPVPWNPMVPQVSVESPGGFGLSGVEGEDGGGGVGAGIGPGTEGLGEVRAKLLLYVPDLCGGGVGPEQGGCGSGSGLGVGGVRERLEGRGARVVDGAMAEDLPDPCLEGDGGEQQEQGGQPRSRALASGFPKPPGQVGTGDEAGEQDRDEEYQGGVIRQALHGHSWLGLG